MNEHIVSHQHENQNENCGAFNAMLAMQCMRLRHLRLHLHHYGYLISSWIPEEMQLCKEISDLEAVEFENASASKLKKRSLPLPNFF